MAFQDWNPVILKKNKPKSIVSKPPASSVAPINKKDVSMGEPIRKRIHPESIHELIQKRVFLNLTQDKADSKCSFPRNTFKDFESRKSIPTQLQQSAIQRQFGVQLRIISDES
jgi:hypothetical protein